jgi:hypothetical protein
MGENPLAGGTKINEHRKQTRYVEHHQIVNLADEKHWGNLLISNVTSPLTTQIRTLRAMDTGIAYE